MESASLRTLFDMLPNEDHHRIEAAANRHHFEHPILGPVHATRNIFLSFLFSFPGALYWSDEEIAQGIDQGIAQLQQRLAGLNATNDQDVIIHPTSPTHYVQQPAVMGGTQTSDSIPRDQVKLDTTQWGQNTFPDQPSVIRPSANQSVLPPSPEEFHELASASPQKMPQSQTHALATPSPSPSATNKPEPLEIPYLRKICDICDADFVWKKTAERCFMCLENKPSHEKIAEIFEGAERGIDSCSNCYGEANRGDNMYCEDCHERKVLKTKRQAAKKKAMRARQAAETGSLQQPVLQQFNSQQSNPQQSNPQQSNPQQSNPQHPTPSNPSHSRPFNPRVLREVPTSGVDSSTIKQGTFVTRIKKERTSRTAEY